MRGKVTGLGGIFFTCKDVQATKNWYKEHLGLSTDDYGCTFWIEASNVANGAITQQWSPFSKDNSHFDSNRQEFMMNFRVAHIEELMAHLKSKNIEILGDMESHDYGKFAWIKDLDGRKLELWEPANEHLFKNQ
jgi:predicted enzyme related to lactoylglutathione lyase